MHNAYIVGYASR